MFFSILVLVSIEREHDDLQQTIYLSQGHLPHQVSDVFRGGLEQEEQSTVQLKWAETGIREGRRGVCERERGSRNKLIKSLEPVIIK